MERFELHPVLRSALPDVAAFLHKWRSNEDKKDYSLTQKSGLESASSIERRLNWLLLDNPVAVADSALGHCLRDDNGLIRGLNLSFPAAFLSADKRLLGLCSGSFFVEPQARSLGFYLFKKYLRTPGYSFYFASTCNPNSSQIWRSIGGCPVPNSEMEYILPIRLDAMVSAYVACKTSSHVAARIAHLCGRSANPILRLLTRHSAKLAIEPCEDWEKLSELSRRHRFPEHIMSDRSPAFLQWRYGPESPSHPCGTYLFCDERGNEGWFSLAQLARGQGRQFRASVLLDSIWPRQQISFRDVFQEILRVAAATSDALSFRRQPGLDYSEYSRCVIPRKLEAPRAFVSVPKGAQQFPLNSFDYDDSDYLAWTLQWRAA